MGSKQVPAYRLRPVGPIRLPALHVKKPISGSPSNSLAKLGPPLGRRARRNEANRDKHQRIRNQPPCGGVNRQGLLAGPHVKSDRAVRGKVGSLVDFNNVDPGRRLQVGQETLSHDLMSWMYKYMDLGVASAGRVGQ